MALVVSKYEAHAALQAAFTHVVVGFITDGTLPSHMRGAGEVPTNGAASICKVHKLDLQLGETGPAEGKTGKRIAVGGQADEKIIATSVFLLWRNRRETLLRLILNGQACKLPPPQHTCALVRNQKDKQMDDGGPMN